MTLKERIIKAIEHKDCTASQLAAAARIRTPSVHGWINGSSKSMKAGPAIKAAAFLGVNPLWLAEGEGGMLDSSAVYHLDNARAIDAREPEPKKYRPLVQRICDIAETIDDTGLRNLIDIAECLARNHPQTKEKAA